MLPVHPILHIIPETLCSRMHELKEENRVAHLHAQTSNESWSEETRHAIDFGRTFWYKAPKLYAVRGSRVEVQG